MDRVTIRLKYVILIIGILLTILTIIAIKVWGGTLFNLDICLKVIGSGIALTALVYATINVHLLYETNEFNYQLKLKENSSNLISEFSDPEMAKLTTLSHSLKKDIKDLNTKEITDFLKNNHEKYLAIVTMLNFYEKLAIFIEHKLVDEKLLKDYFRGVVINTYHVMIGYIGNIRKEKENQKVFEKFENLAKSWN